MFSFFVLATKLVLNESFINYVKLPYRHIAPSWHNLHHKASILILLIPYNFPFLWQSFLVSFAQVFVSLPQGMYIVRFTIHVHLFLYKIYTLTKCADEIPPYRTSFVA